MYSIHNDILQIEIDRMEEEISELTTVKRPYNVKPRLNPMEQYNEEQFRRRFRLTKEAVHYLYTLIGEQLAPLVTRENFTISGLEKILIILRYYATATSVCNIIQKVSDLIASLRPLCIKMPSTTDDIIQSKVKFYRMAGMPGIIDAIDGSLVKIQEVGGAQNKTDFFCRKQFYAINTQAVYDADGKFLDIVGRWPGSTNDQTVFYQPVDF